MFFSGGRKELGALSWWRRGLSSGFVWAGRLFSLVISSCPSFYAVAAAVSYC